MMSHPKGRSYGKRDKVVMCMHIGDVVNVLRFSFKKTFHVDLLQASLDHCELYLNKIVKYDLKYHVKNIQKLQCPSSLSSQKQNHFHITCVVL